MYWVNSSRVRGESITNHAYEPQYHHLIILMYFSFSFFSRLSVALIGSSYGHAQISSGDDIMDATILCTRCVPAAASFFSRFLTDTISKKTAAGLKGIRRRKRALAGVLRVAVLILEELGLAKVADHSRTEQIGRLSIGF